MNDRVRIGVVIVFNIFLIGIIVYLINDFQTPFNELETDSAVIKGVGTSYHSARSKSEDEMEIYLYDKPYFILLSIDNSKYWRFIYDDSNFNKTIQVNYLAHTFSPGILNNPMQLSIDNKIVIPYSASKEGIKHAIKVMILLLVISDIVFFILFKYENEILVAEKKMIDLLKLLIVKIVP